MVNSHPGRREGMGDGAAGGADQLADEVHRMASKVFRYAVAGRRRKMRSAMRALGRLYALDDQVLWMAIMVWADHLKEHLLAGAGVDEQVRIGAGSQVYLLDTGQRFAWGSAQADMALTPAQLWAGAVIDARISMDLDRFQQLCDEAPEDDDAFGEYVTAVLGCVVNTVRHTERGVSRP